MSSNDAMISSDTIRTKSHQQMACEVVNVLYQGGVTKQDSSQLPTRYYLITGI